MRSRVRTRTHGAVRGRPPIGGLLLDDEDEDENEEEEEDEEEEDEEEEDEEEDEEEVRCGLRRSLARLLERNELLLNQSSFGN